MVWKCIYMSSRMDPQSRISDSMFSSAGEGFPGSRGPPREPENWGLTPHMWHEKTHHLCVLFFLYTACPHSSLRSFRRWVCHCLRTKCKEPAWSLFLNKNIRGERRGKNCCDSFRPKSPLIIISLSCSPRVHLHLFPKQQGT